MKKLIILFPAFSLIISLGHAQEKYEGLGWACVGVTVPSGNYSDALDNGLDVEVNAIRPLGSNVGVGFSLRYSQLSYKSSEYDGPYKLLLSNGYLALGSFDPSSRFVFCGLLGLGMHFTFKSERKPTYLGYPYYPTQGTEPKSGYWLGVEFGGVVGYRFSEQFGICGKIQYDILTKFVEGSNYFSAKVGLMLSFRAFSRK